MDLLRIKELLQEKNMPAQVLANKIGMTPIALSYVVNGKKHTTVDKLILIAKALNVEVRDLFNATNEEPIYIKKGDSFVRVGSVKM